MTDHEHAPSSSTSPAPRWRCRPPPPGAPAHRRHDPVRPQLESREQLHALCAEIKAVRPDLLICVDHEGGRVQRFRTDGFTHLPPMRALGELWMRRCDARHQCRHGGRLRAGRRTARLRRRLQLHAGARPGLARAAASSATALPPRPARGAAMLAKSLMHGLLQAGVANCGKHFPGHGFVKADSHTEIPVDNRAA
jgi:beta-N-acetylhexosaminidase